MELLLYTFRVIIFIIPTLFLFSFFFFSSKFLFLLDLVWCIHHQFFYSSSFLSFSSYLVARSSNIARVFIQGTVVAAFIYQIERIYATFFVYFLWYYYSRKNILENMTWNEHGRQRVKCLMGTEKEVAIYDTDALWLCMYIGRNFCFCLEGWEKIFTPCLCGFHFFFWNWDRIIIHI